MSRIALLSDIHDHIWNLDLALAAVQDTDALICSGDLCSPFIMARLGNHYPNPIHVVFGNNDADLYRISAQAARFGSRVKLHGELAELTIGGRTIGVNHYDNIGRVLAASGKYEVMVFGHNHQREVSTMGNTLVINPGTLMGVYFPEGKPTPTDPSFAVLDTESLQVQAGVIREGAVHWLAV
jgi:hypothetical protein